MPLQPPDATTLRTLYWSQGLSLRTIGSRYNVSKRTVALWMDAYEIERRPRGGPSSGILADKQELHELYWAQNLNMSEIAERFEVSTATVHRWMIFHDLDRRTDTRSLRLPKEELYDLYWTQGLSIRKIAKRCHVSPGTARNWLLFHDIKRRPRGNTNTTSSLSPDRQELYDLYWNENLKMAEIAARLQVSTSTVQTWMAAHGMARRPQTRETNRLPKEELYELYWTQGLSLREMGERCNVSGATARDWLVFHDIKRRPRGNHSSPHPDKHDLYDLYWTQGLSIREIAIRFKVSNRTIIKRMKAFELKRRPSGLKPTKQILIDKQTLYDLYWAKNQTLSEIADQLEVSTSTVLRRMNDYEIARRPSRQSTDLGINKQELYELYWTQGLSLKQIGERLELSSQAVSNRMKMYGIERRQRTSESDT